jgi:hypothetical protein
VTFTEYGSGHNHQPDQNNVLVREVKTRAKKASKTGKHPSFHDLLLPGDGALGATAAEANLMLTFYPMSRKQNVTRHFALWLPHKTHEVLCARAGKLQVLK